MDRQLAHHRQFAHRGMIGDDMCPDALFPNGQVDGKRPTRSFCPDRQPASAQGRVGDDTSKWNASLCRHTASENDNLLRIDLTSGFLGAHRNTMPLVMIFKPISLKPSPGLLLIAIVIA